MTHDELRNYCLKMRGATFDFPFDSTTVVYRVGNKIFALSDTSDNPLRINLKCDPELAILLRSKYKSVIPGYHMNKEHWNTIICDNSIPETEIEWFINHSYELILQKLPRKIRNTILSSGEKNV
ncbi:MAG: MmcQ/YjbR family DNA-binding protein [Candidatus Cloacimonetes bacterium]|nr:MmcQ/YjbR family DNA-binding protein [Candidatus Cloacimonadota bacterium]